MNNFGEIQDKRWKGFNFCWTPPTVKSQFVKKGPLKWVLVFCVVIRASRCLFWAIKINYWTIFSIFYRKGGPFWFRGVQKLRTWLLALQGKNPKQIFQPYLPKMKGSNQVWLIWTPFANLSRSTVLYYWQSPYRPNKLECRADCFWRAFTQRISEIDLFPR